MRAPDRAPEHSRGILMSMPSLLANEVQRDDRRADCKPVNRERAIRSPSDESQYESDRDESENRRRGESGEHLAMRPLRERLVNFDETRARDDRCCHQERE